MERVDYQQLLIQDIINLHKSNELNLTPWYQRRSVWTIPQKAYLINTLLENKPIPALYIRHDVDLEKSLSIKEIVDGQQRTRTILEFYNDKFSAYHPSHSKKVKFSQLSSKERSSFVLTSIPIGVLVGADDSDVIDIFGRINSVSKTLNNQEKRNARFSGEMKQLCLKQASSRINFWRNYRIFNGNDIARMNEIEFISQVVYNFINGLSDYTASRINDMYEEFDENFKEKKEVSDRLDWAFDTIAAINPEAITETIFRQKPILFSLMIVLDSYEEIDLEELEKALFEIDAIYKSDEVKKNRDIEFYNATKSTTQRIQQRKIRDKYIRSYMKDA